jgi:putative heme-binding domain-containing protein
MGPSWIRPPLFTIGLVGLFVWAGDVVTRASGGGGAVVLGEGVSIEVGDQVFWGPGKCHTCHSVGREGSTVRCPNLGESAEGSPIAVRAIERAAERSAELGHDMSPAEYLIESLADPSVHVVEGFKDEMPKVYEPPISLGPDQISSVILYLQSLGGTPDPGSIKLPREIREAARRGGEQVAWKPYLDGDSLRGREIFFDVEGPAPCAKCHRVGEEGGDIGPELTSVAGTRTAQFIVESVLESSKEIASGYESVLIQTTSGRILDGMVRRESADSLWLATAEGEEIALALSQVERRRAQELSLMPGDFADLLSVSDLHDLLAYLRTLR